MNVHRCRYVPYPAQPINSLAFSHPPNPQRHGRGPSNLRLAIGRSNGDVEIWNPLKGIWTQEIILRGGRDRTIEGLAWIQDPQEENAESSDSRAPGRIRLFSIGLSSNITEWDLEKAAPIREANSNCGDIWCLSAQPAWEDLRKSGSMAGQDLEKSRKQQLLAGGCSDGSIVLFNTEDGDLHYERTVGRPPTKRPRVLSLTWKDRNTIVAGYADSMIRIYDIRQRAVLRNMSLGKPPDGGSSILVWSVKCLPDGTIVSGDSTGELKIWDPRTYSMLQKIKAHEADILDVAVNGNGDTIVSGGADRRTAVYNLLNKKNSRIPRQWAKMHHRRFHQHDVKSLAVFESKELSVLASGGLDTVPVLVPLREWNHEYQRALPNLPQSPPLTSSPSARLFCTWWDREINIWFQKKMPYAGLNEEADPVAGYDDLVCRIHLKGDENVLTASLSKDGNLLAISTNSSVKLFQLRKRKGLRQNQIHVRRIDLPQATARGGAGHLTFSPDGRWICASKLEGQIEIVRVQRKSTNSTFEVHETVAELSRPSRRMADAKLSNGSFGGYERTVSTIAFSSDSRMVAVADISGCIDTWTLQGQEDTEFTMPAMNGKDTTHEASPSQDESEEDSDDEKPRRIFGQQWIQTPSPFKLPCVDSPVLLLSFRPSRASTGNGLSNGEVGVHVTRHNPHPHAQDLPRETERLLAVTAHHHLLEFDVAKGKLSEWSRRNPPSYLPSDFSRIKDRAMGCFWDLSSEQDRLFLYGSTWIYMIDMNQDLPEINSADSSQMNAINKTSSGLGKRKRAEQIGGEAMVALPGRTRNTGAGDAVRENESYSRLGKQMMKNPDSHGREKGSSLAKRMTPLSDDDDDDSGGSGGVLIHFRRKAAEENSHGGKSSAIDSSVGAKFANAQRAQNRGTRATWHTHTYRPILGIAPISEPGHLLSGLERDNEVHSSRENPELEVVIVERPLWDMDLPERFDGQEWES
ncbi:MAG: hypothetical protein Q9227_000714 [Pyrenula ochraceoflavens]